MVACIKSTQAIKKYHNDMGETIDPVAKFRVHSELIEMPSYKVSRDLPIPVMRENALVTFPGVKLGLYHELRER
jgi:hypothetical protein